MTKLEKLAKLVDKIVEIRLNKLLKSKRLNEIIDAKVDAKVSKLLKENKNIKPSNKKSNLDSVLEKLYSDVDNEDDTQTTSYLDEENIQTKKFSKNPALDSILKQTAISKMNTNIEMPGITEDTNIIKTVKGEHGEVPVPQFLQKVFNKDYSKQLKTLEETTEKIRLRNKK